MSAISRQPTPAPDGIVVPLPDGGLVLRTLVLDLNGTIAVDGALLPGVGEQISRLRERLEIVLVSGDTFGSASDVSARLGLRRIELAPFAQGTAKLAIVNKMGPSTTVVVGNGQNDAPAIEAAVLGICVIGPEGAASVAIGFADVVVTSISAALDLLLSPVRLVATLRR